MVSLQRAFNCPGRAVRHVTNTTVQGTVHHTTQHDVWVETDEGDVVACIPENLEWVSQLPEPLRQAIAGGYPYESAQVGYAPAVFRYGWGDADDDEDEMFSNLAIVYSSGTANDDDQPRALYAIPYTLRRVQVLSITANRNVAWEIEEVLGWQEP